MSRLVLHAWHLLRGNRNCYPVEEQSATERHRDALRIAYYGAEPRSATGGRYISP
jgi:hypothetical protein